MTTSKVKINLGDRTIYEDGAVFLKNSGILDSLYNETFELDNIFVEKSQEIDRYNEHCFRWGEKQVNTTHPYIDHEKNQQHWKIPDEYKNIDVEQFLLDKCSTDTEKNSSWGVGRGSSVSSYCLYLIGIHMVDSIKYNLDIQEFFK